MIRSMNGVHNICTDRYEGSYFSFMFVSTISPLIYVILNIWVTTSKERNSLHESEITSQIDLCYGQSCYFQSLYLLIILKIIRIKH